MVSNVPQVAGVSKTSFLKEVREKVEMTDKVAKMAQKVTSFIDAVAPISEVAVDVVQGTRLLSAVPGLFAVPEFYGHLKDVYVRRRKVAKTLAGLRAIDTGGKIVSSACTFAQGLKAVGGVVESSITWAGPIKEYLLPLEVITLGFAANTVWRVKQEKTAIDKMQESISKIAVDLTAELKIEQLHQALRPLKGRVKKLERLLDLKKGQLTPLNRLSQKVDRIWQSQRIAQKEEKPEAQGAKRQETEALVGEVHEATKTLQGRVQKKFKLSIWDLALRIFAVVCSVLLLLSPFSPVVLGLAALAALIGTGFWFYRRWALPKTLPVVVPAG